MRFLTHGSSRPRLRALVLGAFLLGGWAAHAAHNRRSASPPSIS